MNVALRPGLGRALRRVRGDTVAPWVGGALLAAPILALPWPPATDLAQYEGQLALLVHRGDAAFAPPGLYQLSLGHQSQLFYWLAWPLAAVAGTRAACVFVFAASVACTIWFTARLCDYLGRTRYAALAAAPAAFGWALYWGFAAQLLGLALFVAALPLLDRAACRGTWRSAAVALVATAILGWAHTAAMACACAATAVFAFSAPLDRRAPARLAPAVAGAAMIAAEAAWDRRVATPLARLFASRVLWHPVARKLRGLAENLAGSHGPAIGAALALLVLVAVVLWRFGQAGPTDEPSADERARVRRFAVLAGVFAAAYLALPYSVNFGAFLYVRFLAPAYVIAVVAVAPRRGAGGALVVAPAVCLLLAPLAAAAPQLSAARRDWDAVEPLVARIDPGSAVAVLHFGRHDRSLAFDATAFGNRALAERGGRLLASFAEYPIAPVVVRPELRWDGTLLRLYGRPAALRPAYDLERLRWVLAHVVDARLAVRVVRAFAPEGELVDARGEWMLFRSTLPVQSPALPDGEPPPTAQTLGQRAERVPAP